MTDNTVPRDDVRDGTVECPLCGRQLVQPTDHLRLFGPETPTLETADAIECPVCDGVSFLTPRPDGQSG